MTGRGGGCDSEPCGVVTGLAIPSPLLAALPTRARAGEALRATNGRGWNGTCAAATCGNGAATPPYGPELPPTQARVNRWRTEKCGAADWIVIACGVTGDGPWLMYGRPG